MPDGIFDLSENSIPPAALSASGHWVEVPVLPLSPHPQAPLVSWCIHLTSSLYHCGMRTSMAPFRKNGKISGAAAGAVWSKNDKKN